MSSLKCWQSHTALLLALSMGAVTTLPLMMQSPARSQAVRFSDLASNYWAKGFIEELARRGIISGFPDGTFRPDEPVTRSQFAAIIQKAFNQTRVRDAIGFTDVPIGYWAYDAIRAAYTVGFMTGYPSGGFNPEQNISRAQVLVSLANGLGYYPNGTETGALPMYNDAEEIPTYARTSVAAATEKQIVVNYPNLQTLNPNRTATRAEVAAFVYQALVSAGKASRLASPYIVGQSSTPQASVRIPAGTTLPTRYDSAQKIYVAPEEPQPVPVTLLIDRDIISAAGTVLIPINTQVVGELRLVRNGSQFHARELVLPNGTRLPMDASSKVISTTEVVRRNANVGEIAAGAALGAAAAAGISAITGDNAIATEEVLGGVAFGSLMGFFVGRDRVTLYAINPNDDLDVTLNQPLAISY